MRWLIVIFSILLVITFSANLIANDRPIVMVYEKHIYFPIFQNLSMSNFGDKNDKPLFFYDSSEGEDLIKKSSFVLHPLIPFGPKTIDINLHAPHPPTGIHWLGTDDHGRDILVRLLYGLRLSLIFGLLLAGCGLFIGTLIGATQGYIGGIVDILIGRLLELWTSIPSMFLVLIIVSFMQPNFWLLLGICLMFNWIQVAAATRVEFFRAREQDYVRAAEIMGLSRTRIMFKHILPNIMFAILVYFPYLFTNGIIQLTSLTFLGFGLSPETASLGELLNQSKDNLEAPWIGVSTIAMMVIVLTLLMNLSEKTRSLYKKSTH